MTDITNMKKMVRFDYTKMIKAFAKSFSPDSEFSLSYPEHSLSVLNVAVNGSVGAIECRAMLAPYAAEIVIGKSFIPDDNLERWINRLEFELEQAFLKNMKVETEDLKDSYRIKIEFGGI